ncbi:type II secretion system protein GspG [Alcaligenes faecalis]|uniref:type II secretion system major pseudopilin GspG n=1 Tax=Alcaligenes faecalis TaxID=511 RepID=UPI001292F6E7|nr:type II secretion system major pseudopilin GspG [Alcaligenes faecalis]MBX6963000.1 type II secretion system protein GspG [Providencia rettgeri]MBX7029650.1 type II secretion system protein GspG [Alcaligenes faecalis]QFY78840.1 type II secretion system protein GspG [Alcaligenes faecalis]
MSRSTFSRRPARRLAGSLQSRAQQGFSLIEVMVVVVIMGIMAALVVPSLMDRPDQARAVAARQDIAALTQALKLYRLDNGRYPSTAQGLAALHQRPAQPPEPRNWRPYMDRLPNDPWGNPYQYLQPGVHGEIDVFSLGADGQAGGSGSDADIGNWD